jgi:glycosyltransferase involved in cell wall biosynthesis
LAANLKTMSREQTISFAGLVPYAAVPALLKKHDIFLLASDYEGLPLSLLEAMGHGLVPVVSNLKSGVSEVVNQSNGCLVPVNETTGYAKAIIHLHKHRDELAAKSASARARVQNEFSVAAMTDRWLAALASPPALPPAWPPEEKIFPLVFAKNQILFSPAIRALRRAAAKLRR